MKKGFDIVVIGASVGGLAAAALLAKGGARVLLLEEKLVAPEPAGAFFALDPDVIAQLKLAHHGLRFVRRDLVLSSWDDDGAPLMLPRDRRVAVQALATLSAADAQAWGPYQARLQCAARALRLWWWSPHASGRPQDVLWRRAARDSFAQDCVMGAENFLIRHFESPRLIATLLHDAVAGGFAPSEPGSALALFWRAAQEMAGQQSASAVAESGTLMTALKSAALSAGVQIQMGTTVATVRILRDAVGGVILSDGETVAARAVVSSLPRAATESLAGLGWPVVDRGVGEAGIVFSLRDGFLLPPDMREGRVVIAPPPEAYADAHEAARAGKLPAVLPLACVRDASGTLTVSLPITPVSPEGGWSVLRARLAAAAAKVIGRHVPGFAAALTGVTVTPPKRRLRATLAQLLAPAAVRAATPVRGLYLCGEDAEPLPCVSGRAGRFAAYFAAKAL